MQVLDFTVEGDGVVLGSDGRVSIPAGGEAHCKFTDPTVDISRIILSVKELVVKKFQDDGVTPKMTEAETPEDIEVCVVHIDEPEQTDDSTTPPTVYPAHVEEGVMLVNNRATAVTVMIVPVLA